MSNTNTSWRKRQIALDIKAENARELELDYEPDKTIIEMAREAGIKPDTVEFYSEELKSFAKLVRADEREECAKVCDVFYCDYCADAIREKGQA